MDSVFEAENLATEVKEAALKAGANLAGVVSASTIDSLPSVWVGWTIQEYTKKTTDLMPEAESVIVLGYHVWDDMLELAIRKGEKWVYPEYFPLRVLELTAIEHLERKGFKAVAAHSISYKRLAQLAGFGNYGKNALTINPVYGPWIRFAAVLTNAKMKADKPFEKDLCGGCTECLKACPVGALTPYKVDDRKCMLGAHLMDKPDFLYGEIWAKYEPSLTENSHLMCMECQKACKYGTQKQNE